MFFRWKGGGPARLSQFSDLTDFSLMHQVDRRQAEGRPSITLMVTGSESDATLASSPLAKP